MDGGSNGLVRGRLGWRFALEDMLESCVGWRRVIWVGDWVCEGFFDLSGGNTAEGTRKRLGLDVRFVVDFGRLRGDYVDGMAGFVEGWK